MVKGQKKLAQWFIAHERHLVAFFVGILFICGSFLYGIYHGLAMSQPPMTIIRSSADAALPAQNCTTEGSQEPQIQPSDCQFVGSAKGTKYYPPTCSYAKNIAKENLRCFVSAENAEQQGYTPSTSCK